jgi:chromosome segregation ATPase
MDSIASDLALEDVSSNPINRNLQREDTAKAELQAKHDRICSNLEARVLSLDSALAQAKGDVVDKTTELEGQAKALATARAAADALQGEVEQQQTACLHAQREAEGRNKQLIELKSELRALQASHKELQEGSAAAAKKHRSMHEEVKTSSQALQQAKHELASMTKELAQVKRERTRPSAMSSSPAKAVPSKRIQDLEESKTKLSEQVCDCSLVPCPGFNGMVDSS